MPTIAFASSKGGVGKSTAAVLLASELAIRGSTVTLLDVDPNQPVSRWASKAGKPAKLTVISSVTEETVIDVIEDAARKTAFVIVDLEGTASSLIGYAMSRSDLIIIPTQGSELDVVEAVKAINYLRQQEKAFRRTIPFSLLITRTNPAVRGRTLKGIEAEFMEQGLPVFGTTLDEREAFRAIFSFGGTLHDLDAKLVSNLAKAAQNVRDLTAEVVGKLSAKRKVA